MYFFVCPAAAIAAHNIISKEKKTQINVSHYTVVKNK